MTECECCQCYGIFSTPTVYEKESPCPSSELKIFNNNERYNFNFAVTNKAGEMIVSDTLVPGQRYVACLSETDCYEFNRDYLDQFDVDITIDNNAIIKNAHVSSYPFGYNGNQTLESNTCESYEICNINLKPGTQQRRILNRLFRIYQTSDFSDRTSLHYQTLCWWLDEMQTKIISDHTQRYVLALLYKFTDGDNWNTDRYWMSNVHECYW